MFSRLLPLLLLAVPPAFASASPQLRLLHRVFHPSLPAAPFSERATLHLLGSGPAAQTSLVPSETFADDLLEYASAVEGLNGALYQVALEHPGDADQTQWATSSFPACHLPSSTSESFTVHLDQHGTPLSLDYFLAPIPHNGACPKPKSRKASASAGSSPAQFRPIANTTVAFRFPTFPPLPALRVPPPVTAEGKPVEAVREKSFIEKYWMYMVIALIAMTFAPAPAEEGEGQGQGSGGRK
ncbi:hypothetical protein BD309DRAFT_976921 [Dichomitus squalens]|uniref:Uncharacterized protein n=2 Tax=Dichomitus squalens TaxID=114155 RepID=A0A4Q9P8Q1_9APHY|nr:hypothetical protein BD309DRAFT_976921 [Dichomitus squalens]TBU59121.1 hypothetical protein BD310DRAFT_925736 [Dichomitus squalens]